MRSRRAHVLAVIVATSLGASGARAQGPGVDVADLPPLPATDDEVSSSATLLAAASAEEDVVVGAAKREQTLGNVASAVTVVSSDRIRRFGYRTVSEAIAGVAGVFIQDTRLTQQVGIRGVQVPGGFNSRILVLVDGATLNEAWGAFAGVGYDGLVSIDDIARIEVIRGPVGAVYGTNAFFAIINIVTRSAAEGQRAWGRVAINSINGVVTTAGFAAGGVNQQVRGSLLVMDRFGESLQVDEISADPLAADGARTLIGAVVGQYEGSFLQLRAYRSRRDSPFAAYDSDPTLDPAYSLWNTQALLEGGHTRELSKRLTASVRGYGTLYRFYDEINYAADDQFVDYGDARTIGAEVRGRYELVPEKLGLTAGVEANYNQTESRSFTVGMEPDGVKIPLDFTTQGVYSELDGQPLPWLGFTAGVRFDRNSVIASRLSPRGALFIAKPENYGLKLLYAEGFRNPSAFEGYFADGVDFSANPGIEPETIRSYEAVLWARPTTGLSTRVSAFYWDARDVVEQRADPIDMTLQQFQNVGRYITRGVEVEASYRTSEGWYAFGGGAFAQVGSGETGTEISYGDVVNAPKATATGGVSTPKLYGHAHVSADVQFISRRQTRVDEDGNASPSSPPWTGINATVYVPNLRGFDLTAGVRNILGTRDLQPAPGDYDRFPEMEPTVLVPRIPGEGREVYVKVGYSY
ncbi:MAG: TonB-dependent receptor [Deltaproteobacteria bacterium]|nr:TonB-dependent receptor [Deltaproteobacteria bacterium]